MKKPLLLIVAGLTVLAFTCKAANPQFTVFVDTTARLTPPEVRLRAAEFIPVDSLSWAPKYQRGRYAYWLRFQYQNSGAAPLSKAFSCGLFEHVEVYKNAEDHPMATFGLRTPKASNPHPVFPDRAATLLLLAPGETAEFWVKIKNEIEINRPLSPALYEPGQALAAEKDDLLRFYTSMGCFFVILLFMGLLNLLQFLQNRDRAYLFYSLYLLSLFVFYSRDFDMNSPLARIWPLAFQQQRFLAPLVFGSFALYMQFLNSFLDAEQRLPRLHKMVKYGTRIVLVYIVVDQLLRLADPWMAWQFYAYFKIVVLLLCLAFLYLLLRQRSRLAVYVLLGTAILVLSSLVTALMSFLPTHLYKWWDVTYFPQYVGILLEILFFSIGLAHKSRLAEKERVKVAMQLQYKEAEAQQLKEMDERRTWFYTNISHAFQTPLTVISGVADHLASSGRLNLREGREMILRNSQWLSQLVKQLLNYAKLEHGKLQPEWAQVDLMQLLQGFLDEQQVQALNKNIRLRLLAEQQTFPADVDAQLLHHIIQNLLSNAIKFTPNGGQIALSLRMGHKHFYQIEVSDNGIGIPDPQKGLIFERFYTSSGTGLGLSFAKELSELMGGTLSVESQAGKGSTFTLRLPFRQQAAQQQPAPRLPKAQAAAPGSPLRQEAHHLLVVEDNLDMQRYLSVALGSKYHLCLANSMAAAKAELQGRTFDLMISDVMMETEHAGFDLCVWIRQSPELAHLPLILLTARNLEEDRLSGLKFGANVYLEKPFSEKELLLQIDNLLQLRDLLKAKYEQHSLLRTVDGMRTSPTDQEKLDLLNQAFRDRLGDRSFTVADMAQLVNVSQQTFASWFKSQTGITPGKHLAEVRLEMVKVLLLQSEETIEAIASQTGFTDGAYLSNKFRKAYGMSPKTFRDRHK